MDAPNDPMPPMSPPTAFSPSTPPPPQKSSTLKWVLIGCGITGGLGILACGGCFGWVYMVATSIQEQTTKIERTVRTSPVVQEHIGTIESVEPMGDPKSSGGQDLVVVFRIKGDKGEGKVRATLIFSGFSFKTGDLILEKDGQEFPLEAAPATE